MSRRAYAIGIDFGTESGRGVLVDCADGRELGTSVYGYRNGVIDERLPAPNDDISLGPDWALQDPTDYVRTVQETVPALLTETGVDPVEVIGIGIDFTSCTMAPHHGRRDAAVRAAGVPTAAPRLGEAVEAPRGAAGGGPDQRARPRAG
jgi:ribulose kinase